MNLILYNEDAGGKCSRTTAKLNVNKNLFMFIMEYFPPKVNHKI